MQDIRRLYSFLLILFWAAPLFGQDFGIGTPTISRERATLNTALNASALQPGGQGVLAVILDVKTGFHAQSREPLTRNLIRMDVTPEPVAGVTFFEPIYPLGHIEDYPLLGKLSVYTGQTVIYIPFQLDRALTVGPMSFKGKIRYQICDDKVCFAPENKSWSISTSIVAHGANIEPANVEIFKGFDPRTFANLSPATSGSQNVEPEQSSAGTIFGFDLTSDAYLLAFFGAFVAGIIFNIMPCVLPVVPLKAMSFYEVSQHNRAKCLALGAVFSAGIIATFGVLAVVIVVLHVVEWGQLFGYTWFTILIVGILLILALQTFGVFSVILPNAIYNHAPTHETYLGNFLFGIFTALLSTPCTFGMFLGLLIWASTQPATIGTALIMTVGLGMAFPYLVLSAFPQLARRIPRSGFWSEIVKQMMGFLLLTVAAYFARPFYGKFTGEQGFWWLLFAIIACSGIFLIARTLQFTRNPMPLTIASAIAVLIVAPALWLTLQLTDLRVTWQAYSSEALDQARANGTPVLVKFTADWCLNCQTVETTVFRDDNVVNMLAEKRVVLLKADLTSEDAPGWQLLTQLNPVGAIPLTAVYLPELETPQKLAGIYSADNLLQSLQTHAPLAAAQSAQ